MDKFNVRLPLALSVVELILHDTKDSIQAFDRFQNKFTGNANKMRKFLKNSYLCHDFPEKWFCFSRLTFPLKSLEPIFDH